MAKNSFRKDFTQTVRKHFPHFLLFNNAYLCYCFSYWLTFVEKATDTVTSYLFVMVFSLVVLLQKEGVFKDVKNVKFCFLSSEV